MTGTAIPAGSGLLGDPAGRRVGRDSQHVDARAAFCRPVYAVASASTGA
jgi:hypothetical protein